MADTLPLFADAGPVLPDLVLERLHGARLGGLVAGVDEAGRGPLAGPVVAAAVILDPDAIPEGLNDSKKLSAKRRAALFDTICRTAATAVALAPVAEIDALNVLGASLAAMERAVAALTMRPAMVLVDGCQALPGDAFSSEAVVKGDQRSLSIAAASIVAKVTRDRLMIALDETAPEYGFARHKGYGTALHMAALEHFGPSRFHRMSFKPVRMAGKGRKS